MNLIGVPIPFPDDAMPPEGQYSSREELVTAINAWAAPRGYAFSVKSSVVTPSGRTRVIYSCDRGAGKAPKVKPAKERKRKTTTRRTGCQFSIAAKESLCKTVWSLTHRPGPGFDRHNHEPSFSERAHPVHRHLSSPDRSTVHKLSNAGIEPRKIQSYLHLNSDTLATQQDIYNYITQDRCLACMNALSSPSCFPGSPVLLCLWHINNAVTSYCKPGFTRDKDDIQGQEKWDTFYKHWHGIVASTTEDIYMERLEKFKQQYSPDHLNEVGYIIETWLELYKERFVKAWVHQHRHFQQFVTSRAEGIHRLIKSHMKTSQVDLFGAWNIIKLVLSNQLKRLEEVQSQQQASTPIDISGPLYSNIRGWLSHEALRQLDNQRQRLLREYPASASSKLPPTSTQREPYAFEAIKKETSQKAPPKCSKCGTVGHTSRSKHPRHLSHTTTCRVSPPAPTPLAAAPALRADDPRAIYQRYKEAREAWYATVPRGGLRTNQQYRKAMGLPARYSKIELQWCLNYKQMGSRCREKSGTREWTKEEQFSYLDWDKAENERVEQNVGEEMAEKPFPQRRGMQYIWDAAERDVLQQGGGA
ncbi:hypothetical protein ACKAV7_009874 [Fusarium commune]